MNLDWFRSRWEKSAALVAAIVGVVLLVAGWVGVSGSSLTTEQIPYLASGAVGGLFALGVAATLWLSGDLRDEYFKLDEIFGWMRGDDQPADADLAGRPHEPTPEVIETPTLLTQRSRRPSTLSKP